MSPREVVLWFRQRKLLQSKQLSPVWFSNHLTGFRFLNRMIVPTLDHKILIKYHHILSKDWFAHSINLCHTHKQAQCCWTTWPTPVSLGTTESQASTSLSLLEGLFTTPPPPTSLLLLARSLLPLCLSLEEHTVSYKPDLFPDTQTLPPISNLGICKL